jgi:hypothetical protein
MFNKPFFVKPGWQILLVGGEKGVLHQHASNVPMATWISQMVAKLCSCGHPIS